MEKMAPIVDFLFIDHDKSKYLVDLQLLIARGLLKDGCVVVADNVLSFNQPLQEYLEYVRGTPSESAYSGSGCLFSNSELKRAPVEYSREQELPSGAQAGYYEDGVEVSIYSPKQASKQASQAGVAPPPGDRDKLID